MNARQQIYNYKAQRAFNRWLTSRYADTAAWEEWQHWRTLCLDAK